MISVPDIVREQQDTPNLYRGTFGNVGWGHALDGADSQTSK